MPRPSVAGAGGPSGVLSSTCGGLRASPFIAKSQLKSSLAICRVKVLQVTLISLKSRARTQKILLHVLNDSQSHAAKMWQEVQGSSLDSL